MVDREIEKKVQKEVEQKQEGISLFPKVRNTRHVSNIKFKQIDKALQYVLDYHFIREAFVKQHNSNAYKTLRSNLYDVMDYGRYHFRKYLVEK